MAKKLKIIQMQGLQGSGKSTWSRDLVGKDHSYKRISRDDLRGMIDNGYWNGSKTEKHIVAAEELLADYFITRGFNLIVDDTGFSTSQKKLWTDFAASHNAVLEVKFIDTPLAECIERDRKRPNSVGEKVIRQTYETYMMPKVEPYVPQPGSPRAIMVDIDGTLAHMDGRSPYDPSLYHTDKLDPVVARTVSIYKSHGFAVVVCSGRDDTYKPETEQWLKDNDIEYDAIFMREMAAEPDLNKKRKDWIVKAELFNKYIRDHYDVEFVLDDRNQVVEEWRRLGLKVYQVAKGDF